MTLFTILLGGEVHPTPTLMKQIAGSRVIAADSGMRHAALLGTVPELWIGDFDSAPRELIAAHSDIARQVFPQDKDKTDGELAIQAALELGATELVVVGAFGGERPDHTHLHFTQAISLAERGMPVLLTSGRLEGRPLVAQEEHVFNYEVGTPFSIMAFTPLSGLTVVGAKWPLEEVEVAFGSSLTISNEVRGRLTISTRQGQALLLAKYLDAREG